MNIEAALDFIHSVSWLGSKPGLSRTYELLELLGNPHKRLKFVHVAGTNGKGSTSASIASVLEAAGYRVGLYTSPYINVFNERMQINREMISDTELAQLTELIKPLALSMSDRPTEFEMITALAMEYFARNACDIVVLEVGLGGELDSTNVIDAPELAVICALGLDHTALLGNTLAEIARAKAGIIKRGSHVVSYPQPPDAEAVIREKAKETECELSFLQTEKLKIKSCDLDGAEFEYDGTVAKIPLIGTYQPYNASLAILACRALIKRGWRISEENIVDGLARVSWAGRFELLGKNPIFILDGAHNPHGMRATSESIAHHFGDKKIIFLVGVMADKDVKGIFSLISPYAEKFITVKPSNPRAMDEKELAGLITEATGVKAEPCPDIFSGVKTALRAAGDSGIVIALGSLYFSGDVRAAYNKINTAEK